MATIAHKQTTIHSSSHSEDEVCEGGRSGCPSDRQTALEKLHVSLSDNLTKLKESSNQRRPDRLMIVLDLRLRRRRRSMLAGTTIAVV